MSNFRLGSSNYNNVICDNFLGQDVKNSILEIFLWAGKYLSCFGN